MDRTCTERPDQVAARTDLPGRANGATGRLLRDAAGRSPMEIRGGPSDAPGVFLLRPLAVVLRSAVLDLARETAEARGVRSPGAPTTDSHRARPCARSGRCAFG